MSLNPNCPLDRTRANTNQSKVVEQKTEQEQVPPPRQKAPPSPERRYMGGSWMGPMEMRYNSCSGQYERPDPRDCDPSR